MIFNETYKYINANTKKVETTQPKMNPSKLRRANVPDELVKAYNSANEKLQAVSSNYTADKQERAEWLKIERSEAHEAIELFLQTQEEALK